jgi:hypothetical protein
MSVKSRIPLVRANAALKQRTDSKLCLAGVSHTNICHPRHQPHDRARNLCQPHVTLFSRAHRPITNVENTRSELERMHHDGSSRRWLETEGSRTWRVNSSYWDGDTPSPNRSPSILLMWLVIDGTIKVKGSADRLWIIPA